MKWLLLLLFPCLAFAQRSGLEYSSDEVRRLQASDVENPGMLWVDQGERLFRQHCAACHQSMKGVAARYPRAEGGQAVTLEQKIRHRRPMPRESDELLALTAYVAHESRGHKMNTAIAEKDVEKGKAEYFRRRGQMNLACTHCHDRHAGDKLGAETLSQGQPNGYPTYRLEWQKLGSLQRRLRACMFGLHAEVPPFGDELLNDLELYLAWRARGLPIEAPAVRR
ncbi:MAG: sulfur oxidation c-type cytochrome SoxA [Betaproteobacteria bacterium]